MIWKVVKELNIICKMTGLTCTMQPDELEDCLLHTQSLIRRYTELNHVKQPTYSMVSCNGLLMDTDRRLAFVEAGQ